MPIDTSDQRRYNILNGLAFGVTISSDLRWQNHTSNISAKASRILNFVRRNVYGCSAAAKATLPIPL